MLEYYYFSSYSAATVPVRSCCDFQWQQHHKWQAPNDQTEDLLIRAHEGNTTPSPYEQAQEREAHYAAKSLDLLEGGSTMPQGHCTATNFFVLVMKALRRALLEAVRRHRVHLPPRGSPPQLDSFDVGCSPSSIHSALV